MGKNNYAVFKKWLETAEFEVLILRIPEEEIEDKLTHLSSEGGNITKSLFEDFVIATCVANVNQLLLHLNQQLIEPKELVKIRDELLGEILDNF